MWQRFTARARRAFFYAQEEAGRLGENCISTGHLLLGLVRESDHVASRILDHLGVSRERIRSEIERQITRGAGREGQNMQLMPSVKRVISMAYEEARQLNSSYIGTEHLLLGLISEGEGLARQILAKEGVDLERTRSMVIALQGSKDKMEVGVERKKTVNARMVIDETRRFIQRNELGLRGKSLLSMTDLTREQIEGILRVAQGMEASHKSRESIQLTYYPKSLAMIFEKPSLRTRTTFELGMRQLGWICITLGPAEIGLGTRETVPDIARNLERWVDAIMARVFDHATLEGLRDNCRIPVINGLSDREHPCQILADLYTIQQKKGSLEGLKIAWIGDGNNVLHSLLLGAAMMGMSVAAACPKGYEPIAEIVKHARILAGDESRILITHDTAEAVQNADAVYTDVWTSMGKEKEMLARVQAFRNYQVNAALMAQAKPDALFMHCLPAHRGDEVTDEVMDSPQSVVFDQAENRLHVQKAVLALLIGA